MKRVAGFIRIYPVTKVLALVTASQIIAIGGFPQITQIISTILVALTSLISLTIINDYFNIEQDKIRKLKRPLTLEQISKESSIILSTILFATSIVLSNYLLNSICTYIILTNTIMTVIYSRYKEKSPFSDGYLGCFNGSLVLFGGFSTNPPNTPIIELMILLAILIALTSTARKIAHSIDNLNGNKYKRTTIATYYGDKTAAIIASSLIMITIFLSIIPASSDILGQNYRYAISIADIILAYSGLRILVSTKHAIETQRFTKISMIIIIISFLVGALS